MEGARGGANLSLLQNRSFDGLIAFNTQAAGFSFLQMSVCVYVFMCFFCVCTT